MGQIPTKKCIPSNWCIQQKLSFNNGYLLMGAFDRSYESYVGFVGFQINLKSFAHWLSTNVLGKCFSKVQSSILQMRTRSGNMSCRVYELVSN